MKYDIEKDVLWTDGVENYSIKVDNIYYRHMREEEKEVTWRFEVHKGDFVIAKGDEAKMIDVLKEHKLYEGFVYRRFFHNGNRPMNLVVRGYGKKRDYCLIYADTLEEFSAYFSLIIAIRAAYTIGCTPVPVPIVKLKVPLDVASQDIHDQVRGIHHHSHNDDYPFPGENYNVDGTGTQGVPRGRRKA